jgi:hypothetical protein
MNPAVLALLALSAPSLRVPTEVAGEVVVRGQVGSSLDGSTFDAVTQRDRYPRLAGDPGPRIGGLFDPEAGGLRVIEQDPERHVYRLAPTGAPAPACAAIGARACLAPRLGALAHERLVTEEDLAASLHGAVEAEPLPPAARPLVSPDEAGTIGWLAAVAAALGAAALARAVRRARAARAIGQVRLAAAQARRATGGDATLARARERIGALVERAEELERARAACAARLVRLDPVRLETRRAAWARSSAPGAEAALAALAAESAEADQLASDLAAAVAGLERIASALRAVALRARADRGTRAVAAHDDPVDLLAGELELRELAGREAEADPAAGPTSSGTSLP